MDSTHIERLRARLITLYGDRAEGCLEKLIQRIERDGPSITRRRTDDRWSERDVVLITYGDQIRRDNESPLETLRQFLLSRKLAPLVRTVHLLPFFPYSSDDGFSVIDYRQTDPQLGTWEDVSRLGRDFDLMFDLVLNHVSQQSRWFQGFLDGQPPYDRYFIEMDPRTELSSVTRPRSTPLLTAYKTDRGERHVWTTFSADQVDLNLAEPEVLVELVDVLLYYIEQGARIIRLDAIAYLWKQPGTSCVHLPQTHEVVKLLRDLVDAVAPGVLLLTETNVPHEENISYFGQGDEAHIVYQFSLAPLLLDALLFGDNGPMLEWLANQGTHPPGTTFLNFTASHDGIGVRPLEGLVPGDRLDRLVEAIRARGGLVSTKANPDGSESPYELNITYFDALGQPNDSVALHVQRFLASQAIMLFLRGIPAVYFHSLVGTPNDDASVQRRGVARAINRHKYEWQELERVLAADNSAQSMVFQGYRRLLESRRGQRAFHPDAPQQVLEVREKSVLALLRTSLDGSQRVLLVANLASSPIDVTIPLPPRWHVAADLLGDADLSSGTSTVSLAAYQVVWLSLETS